MLVYAPLKHILLEQIEVLHGLLTLLTDQPLSVGGKTRPSLPQSIRPELEIALEDGLGRIHHALSGIALGEKITPGVTCLLLERRGLREKILETRRVLQEPLQELTARIAE